MLIPETLQESIRLLIEHCWWPELGHQQCC